MNANNQTVAWRVPAWRSFVWAGVAASLVAWTWAWFVGQGAQVFMVIVALATVVLAYRATSGMRIAFVGLMVAGFFMFMAAVYWMFWVMMPSNQVSAFDMASLSLFPMVAAVVLMLGAITGFRHSRMTS